MKAVVTAFFSFLIPLIMYHEIINEIIQSVENNNIYKDSYGLLSGKVGEILLKVECSNVFSEYKFDFDKEIESVFNLIEESAPNSTFCSGLSGAILGIN